MRVIAGALALCLVGCGSTVYRLPGEPITPGGTAQNACESKEFLVIAPTRAEVTDGKTKTSHPRNGLGLYHVGENSPESLTSIDGLESPSITKKRDEVSSYDTKQIIAASLGTVGVIAIAVGTLLFVNAFETKVTIDPVTGTRKESDTVNGTKAAIGGITVGAGFGFGISGLVVNPDGAARTQARATRHVFFDPPDSQKDVESLVKGYNDGIRSTCAAH